MDSQRLVIEGRYLAGISPGGLLTLHSALGEQGICTRRRGGATNDWVLVVDGVPLIARRRTGTDGRLEPGAERSTTQPNDRTARPPGQDKGKGTDANQHRQGGQSNKEDSSKTPSRPEWLLRTSPS
jgi:hypothetical protein